jgi:hypothetical protein
VVCFGLEPAIVRRSSTSSFSKIMVCFPLYLTSENPRPLNDSIVSDGIAFMNDTANGGIWREKQAQILKKQRV